jgi:hypothetical protein
MGRTLCCALLCCAVPLNSSNETVRFDLPCERGGCGLIAGKSNGPAGGPVICAHSFCEFVPVLCIC